MISICFSHWVLSCHLKEAWDAKVANIKIKMRDKMARLPSNGQKSR